MPVAAPQSACARLGRNTDSRCIRMSKRPLHHFADGETPLHVAASHHMAAAVTYLLEKGANANAMNNVRCLLARVPASPVCTRLTVSGRLRTLYIRALICCARPARTHESRIQWRTVISRTCYWKQRTAKGPTSEAASAVGVYVRVMAPKQGGCMVPGLQLSAGPIRFWTRWSQQIRHRYIPPLLTGPEGSCDKT